MPAVSKAQFKKMFVLYEQHKISKQTLDEFTKGVSFKSLPRKKRKSAGRKKSNKAHTRNTKKTTRSR